MLRNYKEQIADIEENRIYHVKFEKTEFMNDIDFSMEILEIGERLKIDIENTVND